MVKAQKANLLAQIGIFLLGISGSLYVALTPANSMMNWYSTDDAFYYFKVAVNVLNGHGFTFDQINLTNGFHPLWMLCCLAVFWLARFHLLLPLRAMIIVSGVLNGLTGILLFRLLKQKLHPYAAVAGATSWILLPSIYNFYTVQGLESAISSVFLALLLLQATKIQSSATYHAKELILLGLIGALFILSRLDNLFVAGVVGFFIIFRVTRIRRLLIYDLVGVIISALLAWLIRFGTDGLVFENYSVYPLMLITMAFLPIVLFFTGFYSTQTNRKFTAFITRLLLAGALTLGGIYTIMLGLRAVGLNLLISRLLILLVVSFSMILSGLIHFLHHSKIPGPGQKPWELLLCWWKNSFPGTLKAGVFYSLPIALLVGAYLLVNKLVFGTWTPVSGQIKTWWGTLVETVYQRNNSLLDLIGINPGSHASPWALLTTQVADALTFIYKIIKPAKELPLSLFLIALFILVLIIVVLLSRKDGYLARKSFSLLLPALIIGCFFQIAYYGARNYSAIRPWYWVSESMAVVILGSIFLSHLFEKLRKISHRNTLPGLILILMIGLVGFLHTRLVLHDYPYKVPPARQSQYLQQIHQLEQETEEGSLIGMTGSGMVGYFIQDRIVVNLDGLINSVQYFKAMKDGTADEFLDRMGMDYVFGNPWMLLDSNPYRQFLRDRLVKIAEFPGSDRNTLYRFLPETR